jgi:hypothetical protein
MNPTLRTTGTALLRRWAGVLLALSLFAAAADTYLRLDLAA